MGTQLVQHQVNADVAGAQQAATAFTPHVDIVESNNAIEVFADMPGVKVEDLDIRVRNREMSIAGIAHPRNREARWLLQEYEVGNFYRTFQLSDQVDESGITAELSGGELKLCLPKAESAKPRRIEVKGT